MSDAKQPDRASGLSGKLVAVVITAVVLLGAALAWILLPL